MSSLTEWYSNEAVWLLRPVETFKVTTWICVSLAVSRIAISATLHVDGRPKSSVTVNGWRDKGF